VNISGIPSTQKARYWLAGPCVRQPAQYGRVVHDEEQEPRVLHHARVRPDLRGETVHSGPRVAESGQGTNR
jgi:hypothetical protein